MEYVAALAQVEYDLLVEVREVTKTGAQYLKLVRDVEEGLVRRYWVEDGLLHAKGSKIFMPKGGKLRFKLMKEHHDTRRSGHPSKERMKALLSRHYY